MSRSPLARCDEPRVRLVTAFLLLALVGFSAAAHAVCTKPVLFTSATSIPAGANPHFVAIGDFNEDGITDLAVANSYYITSGGSGSYVSIHLGQGSGGIGDGTFAPPANYLAGVAPWSITAEDFNEDGVTDLAVANILSDNISILVGIGSGGVGNGMFAPPIQYSAGSRPFRILTGDFNEDGIADLAISNNGDPPHISVLLGQGTGGVGNGSFGAPQAYALNALSSGMASGDFNSDGITDLVATEQYLGTIGVFLGHGSGGVGDGTFGPADHFAAGVEPFDIAVDDFNRDGIQDLAVANGTSGGTAILLGNGTGGAGNGSFAPPKFLASGNSWAVTPADFNQDGIKDIAVGVAEPGTGAGQVKIYLGQGSGGVGNGTFLSAGSYPTGLDPLHLALADFNADGKLDLISSNYYGTDVSLLLGTCSADPRAPAITRVRDVPNDQGGKVFVTWLRSSLDIAGGAVTSYRVWRRIPHEVALARRASATIPQEACLRETRVAHPDGSYEVIYWEALVTLPAERLEGYGYTAPTTQDSLPVGNPYTAFFITALTSDLETFYESEVDSGYSVDNLSPTKPSPFVGTYGATGVALHWGENSEADLFGYRLYRGSSADFLPSANNLIATLPDTGYFDPTGDLYFYKLSAVDVHNNESAHAVVAPVGPTAIAVSLVSVHAEPGVVMLSWRLGESATTPVTVYRRTGQEGWVTLARVTADGAGQVRYEDRSVSAGGYYTYRLGVSTGGAEQFGGDVPVEVPVHHLTLEGVRPNPVTQGKLLVSFSLPVTNSARLELFDLVGRRVVVREVGGLGPGSHQVDLEERARISAGIYVVRLSESSRSLSTKVVVVR